MYTATLTTTTIMTLITIKAKGMKVDISGNYKGKIELIKTHSVHAMRFLIEMGEK